MIKHIYKELRHHVSFTIFGAISGVIMMIILRGLPYKLSNTFFYLLHPIHVFISAIATASMYKIYKCRNDKKKCNILFLLFIGYIGSIGIATLSDSIMPYLGEVVLNMPDRNVHIGFIEKWWIINPIAISGIAVAYFWPSTKFSHFGHVFLSTGASLFHIMMASGGNLSGLAYLGIIGFLFFAVWIPCCVSDIIFPLLFVKEKK